MIPTQTIFRTPFLILLIVLFGSGSALGQGTLAPASGDSDFYGEFEKDSYQEKTDQEMMKEAFKKKRSLYESLLTKESPVYFKSDRQEIIEKDRVFILSGNVSIRKDNSKVLADWVRIEQWTGKIHARGNVEIHFGKDVITGEEAVYNFYTGTGWVEQVRAVVEPSLFLEGERLEKLPDFDGNGEQQYVLINGHITSCAGDLPDWRLKTHYAVIRVENYAQMNGSSFWIKKLPIFYSPYWFYPTKSKRATGLLIPDVSWSSIRGVTFAEEFIWVLGETMDVTFGGTYYSEIGFEESFQWRNAFDRYSRGEMNIEHIREEKSPSETRNPQERWRVKYEQTLLLPMDLRGTANLDFRSDEDFDIDYGNSPEQDVDQFMESRMSLTKYWNLSYLTVDGTFEKDFNLLRDETLLHLPRMEYYSGWQDILGDLKGSIRLKGEFISREGGFISTFDDENGNRVIVDDWLERDALRGSLQGEIWYDFNEVAWFSVKPWISIHETVWDTRKTLDPDHPDGTWATYAEELEEPDNRFYANVNEFGDGLRREIISAGLEWTGPRFYRIYPLLGYKKLKKIKHLIEPRISLNLVPEVLQDEIMEFDSEDRTQEGHTITFSVTNRFLAKFSGKNKKPNWMKSDSGDDVGGDDESIDGDPESKSADTGDADDATIEGDPDDSGDTGNKEDDADADDESDGGIPDSAIRDGGVPGKDGYVREFGYFTISQSYDFMKADTWEERETEPDTSDERILYPVGNLRFDATVNPFSNIYFSATVEYDPYFDDFSNGYLYGHAKTRDWKFGIRWDYSRNFEDTFYDIHALALEGGSKITDTWRFAGWIKYDFSQSYFPYATLDLIYTSQCWGITLHTYYKNERIYLGIGEKYTESHEVRFGLSISLKNVDSVDTNTFGEFWWGE